MSKQFNKYEKKEQNKTKQKRRGVQEDERRRRKERVLHHVSLGWIARDFFVQAYMTEYLKEQDTRINKKEKSQGQCI